MQWPLENRIVVFVPYCDIYKPFILKCLDSIYAQKYSNYELIIVNDAAKDIDFLIDYIKEKKNYILLNRETNDGPASTKWEFLNYIQHNIGKYSMNDIAMIVDGDDFLGTTDAFATVNNKYVETKCWMTYGNATGKFCDSNMAIPSEWSNIRKEQWIYTHPRTFKLALALTFNEVDFKLNGKWLTKGTDRPIVFNCIEMAGKDRTSFIKDMLYTYVEHDNNSYKTIPSLVRKTQIEYVNNLPPKNRTTEDIHIIMCCWKRIESLEAQVACLNGQTVASRIHLHLLNNNTATVAELNALVAKLVDIYTNIKISLSHYDNTYFGFQRFIYVRDILLKTYNIDYVIIIDDDQLFSADWVEKMYNLREPKTYKSWYCKVWTLSNIDYWRGSLVTYTDNKHNYKPDIPEMHYGATCGAIVDVYIFNSISKL